MLLTGLPFTCVYADIRGSFWGDKKFFQPALTELFEETVMVIAGVLLLGRFSPDNVGGAGEMIAKCAFMLLPMSVSLISTGILNSMNYEKQTLRFYFIGAALMLLCVFFLPAKIGSFAYPVGMTAAFVCTACLNMLFLIARCPLPAMLLKKCLIAFAAILPVATCGRILFPLFSKFLSTLPAMLISGSITLLFNLLLWVALKLFPVKKVKNKLF